MPESGLVDCPECGELVSAGASCEECGADLPGAVEVNSPRRGSELAEVPSVHEGADSDQKNTDTANLEAEGINDFEEVRQVIYDAKSELPEVEVQPAPLSSAPVVPAEEEFASDPFNDDCPHFRLEFNDARIFVQGWTASFNFRIAPISVDSAECRMPKLEVFIHGEKPLEKTLWGLRTGRAKDVNFNFRPNELCFETSSEVRLSYQLNGKVHKYIGEFKWDCMTAEESSKVIENLEIKMENVEAGMAADQNINILKDFKAKQSRSLTSRLQDLKLKPIWERLELLDATEGAAPAPKGLVSRLSLVGPGGARLHLLGGTRFTMGRSMDLDITTMLFKVSDCPDGKLTGGNGVSRYQAHLVHRTGQWELRDGGIDPKASLARVKASTYGTYLNGQKVKGSSVLKNGSEAYITFGKASHSQKNTFGFETRVVEDPDSGKVAAVLLERIDSVRESFFCLSGQVQIEDLFPGITSGKLRFHKGGFSLVKNGQERWLKPGAELNDSWACEAYQQIGF